MSVPWTTHACLMTRMYMHRQFAVLHALRDHQYSTRFTVITHKQWLLKWNSVMRILSTTLFSCSVYTGCSKFSIHTLLCIDWVNINIQLSACMFYDIFSFRYRNRTWGWHRIYEDRRTLGVTRCWQLSVYIIMHKQNNNAQCTLLSPYCILSIVPYL